MLPFLCLYLLFCILFSGKQFEGDESRYVTFATHLAHGFYSEPYPEYNLWNGPGYPLILVPFVLLKLPFLFFRLFNSFLLYFSLILCFKSLSFFSSAKSATFFTIVLAFYYPIYFDTVFILTETFSWFLIILICFLLIKYFQEKDISWKFLILGAFFIAYLAMTKIIFGYVICAMIFISLCMFLSPFYKNAAKKTTVLFLISFIFCLPWLFYTYSITHKAFYWGNSGSQSLYTMSSPYENELGDWDVLSAEIKNPKRAVFMDSVDKLKPLEREAAFQKVAMENIKAHPKKYFQNWTANIGRLFFSMPFSNKGQSMRLYFTIIPNMFIVVNMILVLIVSTKHYKKFPVAIAVLFTFIIIYLFASSLVSTFRRMFYITIPFWILVISYFFNNIVIIKIRGNNDDIKSKPVTIGETQV